MIKGVIYAMKIIFTVDKALRRNFVMKDVGAVITTHIYTRRNSTEQTCKFRGKWSS